MPDFTRAGTALVRSRESHEYVTPNPLMSHAARYQCAAGLCLSFNRYICICGVNCVYECTGYALFVSGKEREPIIRENEPAQLPPDVVRCEYVYGFARIFTV